MLEHAFEHVRAGLAVIDDDGLIVRVNPAGAALVGREPGQVEGRPFTDLIHPDDLEVVERTLDTARQSGHGGPLQVRVLLPSGEELWLRGEGTHLPGDPGTTFVMFEDARPAREVADRLEEATGALQREHAELTRRGAALTEFAALVTRGEDVERLIAGIDDLSVRHLAPAAGVLLLSEDGQTLRVAHASHRSPLLQEELRRALAEVADIPLGVAGPVGEVMATGVERVDRGVLVPPGLSKDVAGLADRFPVGTRLIMPLRGPEGALGVLVLLRGAQEERFSSADIDLAAVLASRTAMALRAARLEEERRRAEAIMARRAKQQAAVAELGTLALQTVPLEDLADHCRKLVEVTLEVAHCAVLVDDGHPDGLLLMACSERFSPSSAGHRRATDPALHGAFDTHGSILVPDLSSEDRFAPNEAMIRMGIRSMAATRIDPRSGASGMLSAGAYELDAFNEDDLTFLEALANILASAIDAKRALDDLRHNALHDALTGLPNRVLLLDRLELALAQAGGRGTQVAVLVCDVDRFKVVNDGLGHAAGDVVLRVVADRLRTQMRPGDTVGRFGGDEFVVVCPDISDADAVIAIAERLGSAFAAPIHVLGTELVATASIGIAVGGRSGPDAAAGLLRDADAAMYRAKDRGRARYELFDDAMRARAGVRLRTETELRRGLEQEELVLHYQPVLRTLEGTVVGVEALVRWQHPTRGLLGPAEFVAIAGESGLVPDLGAWAFEEAAQQAARWASDPVASSLWVAVNLAPRQLADPRLLERIDLSLRRSSVDPGRMRVEITEEALVDETGQSPAVLEALRNRGLRISVDDFGTGYSSLAYLKRLPVDVLKLDQGFVAGLAAESDDMVIAAAVIVMAQALGLEVVAEGVETASQHEVLRAMGCDQVQGYLFSHPLPADELLAWVSARAVQ
jgi:diguanylate cyclase (GGDEF)-like protein/PAS domain S-box-containing protein